MATAYKTEEVPITLGRGRMKFAQDDDYANGTDLTLGRLWSDFWHVKSVKVNVASEVKEHENYSSRVKVVDKTAVLKQSAKLTIVCDAVVAENILLYMLGDEIETVTQSSDTLSADSLTVQELGKWHEILNDGDNVYNLTGFSVTDDAGTPVALTEHEDYDVDLTNGLIIFYGDGPLTIVATDIVKITATIPAVTIKRIEGASVSSVKRHVWFCGDPSQGVIQTFKGWVLFSPSGDMEFIGDEWQEFTLEGTLMKHSVYGNLGYEYYHMAERADDE
jgi:hypothetical protein